MDDEVLLRASVVQGMPDDLPPHPGTDDTVDHAPNRRQILTEPQKRFGRGKRSALRHPNHHDVLGPEFLEELNTYGRIIMRRFRPVDHAIKAYPLDAYPARSRQAA